MMDFLNAASNPHYVIHSLQLNIVSTLSHKKKLQTKNSEVFALSENHREQREIKSTDHLKAT